MERDSTSNIYQRNLLTLALLRGRNKTIDIKSKVDYGYKFDDLTIIEHNNKQRNYTFSQTVFLNRPDNKIITSDVLKGDEQISRFKNDFNLKPYFRSYLRINDQFINSLNHLNKLIFYTNVFQHDSTLTKQNGQLMDLFTTGDNPFLCRLNENSSILKTLETMKDDQTLLVEYLKQFASGEKTIMKQNDDPDGLYAYYHQALIKERVLLVEEMEEDKKGYKCKFHQDFINKNNLSKRATNLREKMEDNLNDISWFADSVFNRQVEIEKLPNYTISSEDVGNFCKIFELHMGQSNGCNLSSYIDKELTINSPYFKYYFGYIKVFIQNQIREKLELTNDKKIEIFKQLKKYEQSNKVSIYKQLICDYIFINYQDEQYDVYFNYECLGHKFDYAVIRKNKKKWIFGQVLYKNENHLKKEMINIENLLLFYQKFSKKVVGEINFEIYTNMNIQMNKKNKSEEFQEISLRNFLQLPNSNIKKNQTLEKFYDKFIIKANYNESDLSEKINTNLLINDKLDDQIKYEIVKSSEDFTNKRKKCLMEINARLEIQNLSCEYIKNIRKICTIYKINFKKHIKDVPNFLKNKSQKLCFIKSQHVLLTTIKFYKQINQTDHMIYLNMENYLQHKNYVQVLFKDLQNHVLIITDYDCNKIDLLEQLNLENGNKCIIISNNSNKDLKCEKYPKIQYSHDETGTGDLRTLPNIGHKQLVCQGKSRKLQELIGNWEKLLNPNFLNYVISNNIEIGKNFLPEKEQLFRINAKFDCNGKISDENEVFMTKEQLLVIISGDAGIGKSSFLNNFAYQQIEQINNNKIYIKIELKAQIAVFKQQNQSINNSKIAIDFLLDRLLTLTYIERIILLHCIENNDNVIILFDGFDEINTEYRKLIKDCITNLLQTKICKIVVTTRPNVIKELKNWSENIYNLQPMSENDQRDFLTYYYRENCDNIHEERLKVFVDKILKLLSTSTNNLLNDTPLKLNLLVENFKENCKTFSTTKVLEPDLPKKLNMINLYQNYIKTMNCSIEEIKKFAIFTIFDTKTLCYFFKSDEETTIYKEILEKLYENNNFGIINKTIDNKLHFQHQSFAEYFVATYLMDHFLENADTTDQEREFFLNDILCKNSYQNIRVFLNAFEQKLHEDIYKQYANTLNTLFSRKTFGVNKISTILCTAVEENNIEIVKFLLECIKNHTGLNKLLKCMKNGNNPLHLAAKGKYFDIIFELLENNIELDAKTVYLVSDDMELLRKLTENCNINRINDENGNSPLHYAAENGKIDKIWNLLEFNVDINILNKENFTPLKLATKNGHKKVMEILMKYKTRRLTTDGANIDDDLKDLLHLAAFHGQNGPLELLLQSQDINSMDKNGNTALHYAINGGHLKMVKFLHENNANIEHINENEEKPIHLAIMNGNSEIVQYLYEKMKKSINEDEFQSLLKLATEKGKSEILDILLKTTNWWKKLRNYVETGQLQMLSNVNNATKFLHRNLLEKEDEEPNTIMVDCLKLACKNGQKDIIEYVKQHFTVPEHIRWDFIEMAAKNGHKNVVKLLLNNDYRTAIEENRIETIKLILNDYLESIAKDEQLIKKLLDKNLLEQQNIEEIINIAAKNGYENTIKLLKPNDNTSIYKIISLAIENNQKSIVELLASTNQIDGNHLITACKNNDIEIMKVLLLNGAKLYVKDNWGNTILHIAIINEQYDIVHLLLENKLIHTIINVKNKYENTPLMLALQQYYYF